MNELKNEIKQQIAEYGRQGGKKHNAQKSKNTLIEKYGEDYFSKIAKMKKRQATTKPKTYFGKKSENRKEDI